jgi:quinohemoprotein ethanol dehydrogenase
MEATMKFGRWFLLAVVACAALAYTGTAAATPNGFTRTQRAAAVIPSAPAFAPNELVRPAAADWATNGGDYGQTRYSTLNQINTDNVANLKVAWHIHLGSGLASKYKGEGTPLVYQGIMYVVTGNSDVFAINATDGTMLWTYHSLIPQFMNTVCCGWDARGLALGDGKVFVAQLDGTLVALDQQNGGIVWTARNARWQDGYTMTMAPLYYNGLVYVGVSGSEFGSRGSETAYDAKTGDPVWRFYNTPTPGDIGSGTWPNNSEWAHGGATVWNQPTVDPSNGMIYFSTANADPWSSRGPGDDLFTSSIVALSASKGAYKWHFQAVHHDIWDYDCPSNTVLFNATIGGQLTPVVAEPCKTGWVYELNRNTGNPATEIDERAVPQNAFQNTSATQPIPAGDAFTKQCPVQSNWPSTATDGKPYLFGCIYTPFDDNQFTVVAPGAGGGNNWNPASYNPNTGYLYVCSKETSFGYKAIPNASSLYRGGLTFIGLQFAVPNATALTGGQFVAMNMANDKIAWQQQYTLPPVPAAGPGGEATDAGCDSGSVTTAGNLVFMGLPEGLYKGIVAYNAATGQELWRGSTGTAGVEAPPMTYSVNGKQYLAVYAGGCNAANCSFGAPATAGKSDDLYAFALP